MSAAQITAHDSRLEAAIESIERELQQLRTSREAAGLARVKKDLDGASRMARHMDLECRMLSPDEMPRWKRHIAGRKEDLRKLEQQYELLSSGHVEIEMNQDIEMDVDETIAYGKRLQGETVDAAERTLGVIDRAEDTGRATAQKLREQGEQIARIHDELYEIDDMLERSVAIVKRMMRRTATDKYIWCLTFVVLAIVVAIIVIRATGGNSDSSDEPR
ncbi:MAG: hypothetical protein MHM6MM_008244 [Cercozoa sp. M6MM]